MSAQVPDKILFSGDEYSDLYTNPLELYWITSRKKRPEFSYTNECRRGYVAYWVIKNNQLFLKSIEGEYKKRFVLFGKRLRKYTINTLFPRSKNKLVLASWFSGKLRIPQGNMTMYEDVAYDSRFEKELIITVDKGEILKVVTLDYTQQRLTVISDSIH
ncbi:MAG TPA: hypothetical protein VIM65_20465 [Cyclobacteriaceae bacterium]